VNASDVLLSLRSLDIKVWADGDRLRVNAPKGRLTPELQRQLAECKGEILTYVRRVEADAATADPPLQARGGSGPAPLTYAQEGLWLHDQLTPSSAAYNVPAAFPFSGQIDVGALERSLDELARRHEALRTTFRLIDGEPVQVVDPAGRIGLAVVDLRQRADLEDVARRLVAEEAARPFDLSRGPLCRATLLRTDDACSWLLVTLHHIIVDGWSLGVLIRELRALYEAHASGRAPALPTLPVQCADYAAWQRATLQGETLDRHVGYWRRMLGDDPPALELPTDRPRPAEPSLRGAVESFEIDRAVWEALTALSRRQGATLYMTLLAAFEVLLHRYSGQTDIVIGTPAANRGRVELENLIGLCANTLVLRTDLTGNPTFHDLLARVREVTLEAQAHQELPFELLVRALRPRRDPSRTPFFQVLFAFEKARFSPLTVGTGASRYDLSLFLWEEPDRLSGMVEYSTDLFDAATVQRMVGHLRVVLDAVVSDPDCPIAELPLLTAAERHRQLVAWNATAAPVPECTVHALVEAQAARTPDRIALGFGDQTCTYRALNERANRLARRLRTLGVGPNRLVGVCLERSPALVVALLAVLKAGGAYVPLDPAYPRGRLGLMIQDADLSLILTQSDLHDRVSGHAARTVCLDVDACDLGAESADDLPPLATPNDLAYTIYTSGSTGTPKGVQIEHRAVVNLLASMRREPGLGEQDILLALTTVSFDIAVLEIFLPLMVGARLVLAEQGCVADGGRLSKALAEAGATIMQATPVTWRLLLQAGWRPGPDFTALCGGEELPRDLAQQLLASGVRLWNMYGPTETTVWSALQRVEAADGAIPIGRPIANTSIVLLDRHGQPVPVGVPGELHIGGLGLARGYRNRPDLTAEKLIANPFESVPGARLYKTGDLARYRADGTIELIGRLDRQVKLRGYRIELGEIEAAVGQHPAVHQAVVAVREDTPGDRRLTAYVVPSAPIDPPSAASLRHFLQDRLPAYMVPSAFVTLSELPLTPNGKIDRAALPSLIQQPPEEGFVAPRTPLERRLAEIFSQVLGVGQVGIGDNFFDLGGHSLLAVQVVSRARDAFGLDVPVHALFETPTVEGLASTMVQEDAAALEDDIESLLQELEALSDEETQARLLAEGV
jgi:amino acid adenylation domain-containing protein